MIATNILMLATAVYATSAVAQQARIKPGLWEILISAGNDRNTNPIGKAMQELADHTTTPEQREELEKSRADLAAKGIEETDNDTRMKECLTNERIARFDILGDSTPESCMQEKSLIADGINIEMKCVDPEMKTNIHLIYQGEKAYTFETDTIYSDAAVQSMNIKMNGSAKWLSSDCGKFESSASSQQ